MRPFPPTYCISCAQQPQRGAVAREHFQALGIPVHFVKGVYGPVWGLETRLCYHDDYRISSGYVGLNLTHWMIWQYALLAGHAEVLILEDDCQFSPDFLAEFWKTYDQLPADWQLWYVGTVGTEAKPVLWANERLIRVANPFGTHCYLVKDNALPVLLETNQQARVNIDIQIAENSLPRLRYYVSRPNLARQLTYEKEWVSSK